MIANQLFSRAALRCCSRLLVSGAPLVALGPVLVHTWCIQRGAASPTAPSTAGQSSAAGRRETDTKPAALACAKCKVSFQTHWLALNHLHEHDTGFGHRCRLGCTDATPGTFADSLKTEVDQQFLWFESEHSMRLHHVVHHGATWQQAGRRCSCPRTMMDPSPSRFSRRRSSHWL